MEQRRRCLLACVIFMALPMFFFWGCSRVDDKISDVRPGASVGEIIQLLGKPDGAWGSVIGSEMVFVYRGKKTYSILFFDSTALKVVEGELGGPDAIPFREKINVITSGNRIEFRR